MSNTCTAAMTRENAPVNYKKKPSLKERFVKYILDNQECILGGLSALNGHIYIPDRTRR